MRYFTEIRAFYREFRGQYRNTGSILPSSRSLARALTGEMRKAGGPRRILEVGPGTGAVTRAIVSQLRPDDRLDIVEINDRFLAILRARFENEPAFRCRSHQTRLIHAPVQEVAGVGDYDFMISGLPLNNFPVRLVRDIFRAYRRLLKPGGILSYFEYVLVRDIKVKLHRGHEKKRMLCLDRLLRRNIRAYQVREEIVLWNMPPAVVRHLCFEKPRATA